LGAIDSNTSTNAFWQRNRKFNKLWRNLCDMFLEAFMISADLNHGQCYVYVTLIIFASFAGKESEW